MLQIQAFVNITTIQCRVVDTDEVLRLVKQGHLLLEYLQYEVAFGIVPHNIHLVRFQYQ